MVARLLLVALALLALSDVTIARVGNKKSKSNVNVSSGTAPRPKRIRKSHHRRRHLAGGPGKDPYRDLKIVDGLHVRKDLKSIRTLDKKTQAKNSKGAKTDSKG